MHGVVATARVAEADGRFRGVIDLTAMPAEVQRVFEEYEGIVNDQGFSLIDDFEQKISDLGLRVNFGGNADFGIQDLQMYPRLGRVSFRLSQSDFEAAVDYVLKKNAALYEWLA